MQKAQVVKYKCGKNTFEIGCKPGTVLKYRSGKLSYSDVLDSDEIWIDMKKGDRASDATLMEAFNTSDKEEVTKTILQKGELQLSEKERKEFVEKKRREIVNYLHKYYVDAKTKKPHPVVRIENAINDIKYRIDPDKPAERQANEMVRLLVSHIPLKKSELSGLITVPHQYLGATGGILKQYVKIENENYNETGCEYRVSLVPGDYEALIAALNQITKGEYFMHIDGEPGGAETSDTNAKGKGKGKGKGKRRTRG